MCQTYTLRTDTSDDELRRQNKTRRELNARNATIVTDDLFDTGLWREQKRGNERGEVL